jgi:hypothetical protein
VIAKESLWCREALLKPVLHFVESEKFILNSLHNETFPCHCSIVEKKSCIAEHIQGPEPAGAGLSFLVQSAGGSPDCPLLPATSQVHAMADTCT